MKAWIPFCSFALVLWLAAPAHADRWDPFRDNSVVQIITTDEGGDLRETNVWIVVIGDAAFVRTNNSHWLDNIRHGCQVKLRSDDVEVPVRATEAVDEEIKDGVEEAFLEKYGLLQRIMSTLRFTEPTVLRLDPK